MGSADGPTTTLEVFRYRPDDDAKPTFQTYQVPFHDEWVVLDALNHVKNELDGTLSYRWSCRMAVCGSCGMMVNGEPRLTCSTFLNEFPGQTIRVEPLTGFPVIRDLVIDMDGFIQKMEAAKTWLIPKEPRTLEEGAYRQSPAELAHYKQFSMCINCMLCYAACPVVADEPEFVGPAVLALAHRYNLDSRDGGEADRADVLRSHGGVWECTFVGDCSAVCPKQVDPSAAIQQEKMSHAKDWWKALLMPWGKRS